MSTNCRLPGLARLLPGVLASLIAGAPCAANVASTHVDYPRRTIRIIVPASSGAADDFFARKLGDDLAALYKQRILVDNRPGAGGMIGNRLLSKAGADGYTLGMISVTRIISELMHEKVPYRSLGDIVGVAHVASITNVLAVTPTIPLRGARDFVTYARVRPGELNYASLGIASASHLAAEVFNRILRIDAVHIPYRNVADSYTELATGRVHYTIYTLPAALAMVREGRLRALAVMTPKRSPTLPDVPSVIEIGLPEVQYDSWSGLVAPVGTPRRVVEQLHSDIMRGLRKTELRQLFLSQGAESTPDSTPDGFMRLMQDEYLRFQAIIRETGVKPE